MRLFEGAGKLDLDWRADMVRATNVTTGRPRPRIPSVRLGATLIYGQGPWSARVGFDHYARQDRVPPGELETGGYTLWHAGLTSRGPARHSRRR